MRRTTTKMAGAVVLASALALTACAEEEPVDDTVVEEDAEVGDPVPDVDVESGDIEMTGDVTGDAVDPDLEEEIEDLDPGSTNTIG